MSLREMYDKHDGKITDTWSLYVDELDRVLSEFRDQQITILEIGVQNGGSLEIWSKYFPKAQKIVGVDIDPKCGELCFADPRISVLVSDATSEEGKRKVLQRSSAFDVVIDDGSHRSGDIVRAFSQYFPVLKEGGLYIVEDLHTSYWADYDGGLHNPLSAMAFLRRLADITNYEHWHIDRPREYLLKEFSIKYEVCFENIDLVKIHSVLFVNSLCIIRKAAPDNNVLGKRIIVGNEELVTSEAKKMNRTVIHDFPANIMDDTRLDIFEVIKAHADLQEQLTKKEQTMQQLQTQLAERDGQIASLNQVVSERDGQITNLNQGIAERDGQIASLNQVVSERDGQNANLNQGIAERDGQITNLNQGIAERDGQIANLNQGIAERDGQIISLNQGIIERDGHITNLNQGIVERDGQIVNLNQGIAERDARIISLNQVVTERDGQIATILSSASWRVTWPLRWVGAQLRRVRMSVRFLLHTLLFAPKRFDAEWYLKQNPDVAMSGMHPYKHYILYGKKEGRRPAPDESLLQGSKSSVYSEKLRKTMEIVEGSYSQARKSRVVLFLWGVRNFISDNGGWTKGTLHLLRRVIQIFQSSGILGIYNATRYYILVKYDGYTSSRQTGVTKIPCDVDLIITEPVTNTVLKKHTSTVTIIITVHNALSYVKQCLASVIRYSTPPYSLILVDDGSDEETRSFLEDFTRGQDCTLIRNDKARGYTRAANQGLTTSESTYTVLLNSDTIVGLGWLDRMIACAESNSSIGIVGPLSNIASYQSIPEILGTDGDWCRNELPAGMTVEEAALLVAKESRCLYPSMPFLNGFCLLIKSKVLEQVGYFDEENFGDGFGEENDYCIRTRQAGWKLAIADDVYVYHWQSKSYGDEKRKLLAKRADDILASRYDQMQIWRDNKYMRHDKVIVGMRTRAGKAFERDEMRRKGSSFWEGKRVLFILPICDVGGGGNVIFQEARAMISMGVDACILNLSCYRPYFEKSYPNPQVPILYADERDITDIAMHFDAVIATHNRSVYWLQSISEKPDKPVLGYYIQDFEPYFYAENSSEFHTAVNSYDLFPGLVRLTKTEWNRNKVREYIGVDCLVVGPSVNVDLFYPRPFPRKEWLTRPLRVIAMIRPSSLRRAPALTMEVLQNIKKSHGSAVEIILFGESHESPDFFALPHDFEYRHLGVPSSGNLSALFNQADIFVDFSSFQAMGLTAMEAMACGCAVIVPETGGAKSFAVHEKNSLIIDTSCADICVNSLQRLITDTELRNRLREQAIQDMVNYYPERAAYAILHALFNSTSTKIDQRGGF